jgi:intein/homing endonuclease
VNYATELARISVQPQNYSDENWDEAMILCDKADAEINALEIKYKKLRTAYNDQIRIIEEQANLIERE